MDLHRDQRMEPEELRRLQRELRFTNRQMELLCGVKRDAVLRWRNGTVGVSPTAALVIRLAHASMRKPPQVPTVGDLMNLWMTEVRQ